MTWRSDARRALAAGAALFLLPLAPVWAQPQSNPGAPPAPTPEASKREPTAQPQDQAGTAKFSARSELVLVPVVVVDKSNAAVLHLSKEDFRVFENGQEQTIKVFEEAHSEETRVTRPLPPKNEYTNSLTSDTTPRRLEIIVFDTVNTPFLDQAYAREQLVEYLARNVQPGTLVSLLVINWHGLRVVHDFTTDTSVLIAALRKLSATKGLTEQIGSSQAPSAGSLAAATEMQAMRDFVAGGDTEIANHRQELAIDTTLQAFESIAQAYAGVPGRKALLWATGGVPFRVDPDDWASRNRDFAYLYEHALHSLNAANIALYPVDARGLVVVGLPDASAGPSFGPGFGRGSVQGGLSRALRSQWDLISTMKMLADMTGGRAFYNRNDISTAFEEARRESSVYYMLGYYLDPADTAPGWRKLRVEVLRKGVHARCRSGFFVTQAPADPEAARRTDIAQALQSPLEYTSLPVTLRWTGTEIRGEKRRVRFEAVLPPNTATVDEDDGNHVSLEFIAVARNDKGDDATHFDQNFEARLKPGAVAQIRTSGVTYRNLLELAPGEYLVRLVVRDTLSGRVGSVSAPLKVE
jgi:VWFA-related protein